MLERGCFFWVEFAKPPLLLGRRVSLLPFGDLTTGKPKHYVDLFLNILSCPVFLVVPSPHSLASLPLVLRVDALGWE